MKKVRGLLVTVVVTLALGSVGISEYAKASNIKVSNVKNNILLCDNTTGWNQEGSQWYYTQNDGVNKTGWLNVNNIWYFMNQNGAMVTGWVKSFGSWYYMNQNGSMATGWEQIDNQWYLFGDNGAMLTGWNYVQGHWYYMGHDGAMVTGWQEIDGQWYLLGDNGAMLTGWNYVQGHWYYMQNNGAMETGLEQVNNNLFLFNSNGAMVTGWNKINNKWYYFGSNGEAYVGDHTINGIKYDFNSNGVWTTTGESFKSVPVGTLTTGGIDISNWQSDLNLSEVKKAGYNTAIILAGDGLGNFISPTLNTQYQQATNAGMNVGFYYFFRPNLNIEQQAQEFWNAIKGKRYNVYPVLDVETGTGDVTNQVLQFLSDFKKLSGQDCIIYTYENFANNNLDSRLSKYKCWLADYGVPVVPSTNEWKNTSYVGWQYSDSGQIANSGNTVDLDKFNGGIYMNGNDTYLNNNNNTNTLTGTTITTANYLCLNQSPEANAGTMAYIPKGSLVYVLEENNNGWYKVSFNGQVGWISAYYTQGLSQSQLITTVTAGSLCMNSSPAPNTGLITYLHSGDNVTVLGANNNGWLQVASNGNIGWISGKYTSGISINNTGTCFAALPTNKTNNNPTESLLQALKNKQ